MKKAPAISWSGKAATTIQAAKTTQVLKQTQNNLYNVYFSKVTQPPTRKTLLKTLLKTLKVSFDNFAHTSKHKTYI